jgi:hypothetical protein
LQWQAVALQAVDKPQPAPPLVLPRKRAGEKIRKEAVFSQGVESNAEIVKKIMSFSTPC